MCKTINFNEYKLRKISQRENERKMFENITNEIRNRRQEGYVYKNREMEEISKQFLSKLNDQEQYDGPIPIVKIAKKLGFNVYQQDMEKELSGFIAIDPEIKQSMGNDKIIVVNVNDEIGHQRFVIAHELAHYLFDFLGEDKYSDKTIKFSDTYHKNKHETPSELRANSFAAAILMPEILFINQYNRAKSIDKNRMFVIMYLSRFFETTMESIEKRIAEVLR